MCEQQYNMYLGTCAQQQCLSFHPEPTSCLSNCDPHPTPRRGFASDQVTSFSHALAFLSQTLPSLSGFSYAIHDTEYSENYVQTQFSQAEPLDTSPAPS